jgi:hypothetical protein
LLILLGNVSTIFGSPLDTGQESECPAVRKSAPKVQALSTKLSGRNTGRKHCSCCKIDQFCADSSARSAATPLHGIIERPLRGCRKHMLATLGSQDSGGR